MSLGSGLILSQVVVMDALAVRLAAGSARSVHVFQEDMPQAVPLQRWDVDNDAVSRLDGRLPTRFAAFMQGLPDPLQDVVMRPVMSQRCS